MDNIHRVAEGLYSIDVEMWVPRFSSVYLVVGERIALVETGLSTSSDKILAAIEQLGFHREQINHIIVTHIHLDHAGGWILRAGECLQASV